VSLASDLVPYISDPTASLILASLVSANWTPAPDDPHYQSGVLQFRVTELFSDQGPKPGEVLTIAARRYGDVEKRLRMGFDNWNTLDLEPGNALVLAARPDSGNRWTALAAEDVPAGDNELVPAVRRARSIEKQTDPAARTAMLNEALKSPQDLLFRYALDAITRRALVPRNEAANMMAGILVSNGRTKNVKLSVVQQMTKQPIYQSQRGADPVNRTVISSVAGVLAGETEPQWSEIWTQFLAASLLPAFSTDANQDREIRQTLIRAVSEPARRQVPDALVKAEQQSPTDTRIPKLLEAWRLAVK